MLRFRNLLFITLLLLIFSCQEGPKYESHLTDDEMIEIFEKEREEFVLFVKLLGEDRELKYISTTWIEPLNLEDMGFSKDKIKVYRKTLRKIGLSGIYRAENGYEFVLTSEGMLDSGSSKGYYFSEQVIDNKVSTLDNYKFTDPKVNTVFRQITDNWYLYYYTSAD